VSHHRGTLIGHGNGPIGLLATYLLKRTLRTMKAMLTATAVIGALAAGSLPALALTLTGAESGHPAGATVVRAAAPAADSDDAKDPKDAKEEAGTPGWMRPGHAKLPPGWVRNHQGGTPFGWQMRSWAKCVSDSAAGANESQDVTPPANCGTKPTPPHGHAVPGHANNHAKQHAKHADRHATQHKAPHESGQKPE
jgi:hypothetical protein